MFDMTENFLSEGMKREQERVEFDLSCFFFDDTVKAYENSLFFAKLCLRDVQALASEFFALPRELHPIAFHHAVLINRADVCKAVLSAANALKEDINTDFATDVFDIPPLMTACRRHCRRSFLTLVNDGGADLSVCDEDGYTLARACVESDDLSFMWLAQKSGVVFDVADPVDALIPLAASLNERGVLRWLIEDLNGDVNLTDGDGWTASDHACWRGNREMFLYLLDKGGKMTDKREALFGLIIEQIGELRKQPPSETVRWKIDRHIETMRFLMSKA